MSRTNYTRTLSCWMKAHECFIPNMPPYEEPFGIEAETMHMLNLKSLFRRMGVRRVNF